MSEFVICEVFFLKNNFTNIVSILFLLCPLLLLFYSPAQDSTPKHTQKPIYQPIDPPNSHVEHVLSEYGFINGSQKDDGKTHVQRTGESEKVIATDVDVKNDWGTCESCGKIFDIDCMYPVYDGEFYVCDACLLSGDLHFCESCERLVVSDEIHSVNDGNYYICEGCFNKGDLQSCKSCDKLFDSDHIYKDGYCITCY